MKDNQNFLKFSTIHISDHERMSSAFSKSDIGRLIKGDETIFEDIFNLFYTPLVIYATGYLTGEEQAREIVQEAFLKLWEKKGTLSPDTNIRAYMYAITRNLCLNHLDHLRVGRQYLGMHKQEMMDAQINYIALSHHASDHITVIELAEKIKVLIRDLPEKNRKIFAMHRFRHMTYREIAAEMNISVKAVEAHISRALKHLKENLPEYF